MKISRIKRALKRNETKSFIKMLEELGYFKFLKTWEDFIEATIGGIVEKLSTDDYFEIQEIKFKALEFFKDQAFIAIQHNDLYDNLQFNKGCYDLADEHYQIVKDYYIDDDINNTQDVGERFSHMNDANFLLSKRQFIDKLPALKSYISGSLELYKNKLIISEQQRNQVKENIPVSKVKKSSVIKSDKVSTFEEAAVNEEALKEIFRLLKAKNAIDDLNIFIAPANKLYAVVKRLRTAGYIKGRRDINDSQLHSLTNERFSCNSIFQNWKKTDESKDIERFI